MVMISIIYTNLGDNCIQIFHLGMYIIGYTVGNLVLGLCVRGAVKRDFRMYIRQYTYLVNENFEYDYPHSNALLQSRLKIEHCKPHNAALLLTKCETINDFKLFPTVYHRICDILSQIFYVIQSDVALKKQVH